MEAFSFLKYWRPGGGAPDLPPTSTTAILTAITETDDESNTDDEGPFFDLEFTVPDEPPHSPQNPNHTGNDDVQGNNENNDSESESECECERELKLTPSPSNQNDPNLSLSPSDDIVVHLELNSSEPNSKPHFTAASSLLKSATKFRVFMSGLKKTKSNIVTSSSHNNKDKDLNVVSQCRDSVPKNKLQQQQKKLFTVKFKVEEVPIMSLFTRDNSSRVQNKKHNNNTEEELQTQTQTQTHSSSSSSSSSVASDEKRLHNYLKMVKPLYVKVSKRYSEKVRFSGQLNMAAPPSATASQKTVPVGTVVADKVDKEEDGCEGSGNVKGQKQRNLDLSAGLRVVCKHLRKSRSAAETTAENAPVPATGVVSSRRRDDSLLQQQDGIQGAILHCKRSFNASRECESSQLPQGVRVPQHEISTELSRKSTNEDKSNK